MAVKTVGVCLNVSVCHVITRECGCVPVCYMSECVSALVQLPECHFDSLLQRLCS